MVPALGKIRRMPSRPQLNRLFIGYKMDDGLTLLHLPNKVPGTAMHEREDVRAEGEIQTVLRTMKAIALVGASAKPWRESNGIMQYLLGIGFDVYPVNPLYTEVLGRRCYPNLYTIPVAIDVVNVFRDPDKILPLVQEAIDVKAKTLWMQVGVINHHAAETALEAGLRVIMDRCIAVEHRLLPKDK